MPDPTRPTWIADIARRSKPGDRPWGMYWAMPLAVAAASLCLAAAVASHPNHTMQALVTAAWMVSVAAIAWHLSRQVRWDRGQYQRRLSALEAVIDLTAASGAEDVAELTILQRLPSAMRTLLGAKIVLVGLLEEEGKFLHIVAGDGVDSEIIGEHLTVADMPMTQRCLETRYAAAVADVNHSGSPLDSQLAHRIGLRMMMQVPLIHQDQIIGMMIVGERRPRLVTDLDIRRAWLWACLTAVMITNCRMYRRINQSIREQRRLWQHRDALYSIDTAIHRPGTLDEILQRIVDRAPGPLEVDAALIWLPTEENPDELYIGAATRPFGEKVHGFRMNIRGGKTEAVMRQRQVVVVENGPAEPNLNAYLKSQLPHGSLIFEPLVGGDDQPLGLLVLMRRRCGTFADEQIELARMFSARASAAIETAQLYQQTRRDADDKTMLLRELNHRVKNNLASIVSLLLINQPTLDAEGRQWLARAVERIGAMAKMHELFSESSQSARSGWGVQGNRRRVTMAELVEQTVRSVSVAKPASVAIKTELDDGTSLRADRAVSLAMAMHELCYNGLVHNLSGGGTLTIRSHRSNGDLAVEVEDDAGAGKPAGMPIEKERSGHNGIGLSLVRGLVGRELRGRFALEPAPGGAVAKLRFPLLPDESQASTL